MDSLALHIVLSCFFILCSAFFSGAETALFSLSRARLLDYAGQSSRRRQFIVLLMKDYQRTLTAIVLGNMFMNASLAISINGIVGRFAANPALSLALSLSISLVVLLLGGEVTPKAVAILNAERVSDMVAAPLWYYRKAATPFVLVAERLHSVIWNFVGRRSQPPLAHDEYYAFVDMARDIDAFSESEARMLEQILDLNAIRVSKLVRSRMDISCVSEGMSAEKVEGIIRRSRQKFLPVARTSIDDADMMLSAKRFLLLGKEERKSWKDMDCCFEAAFIPEQTDVRKALPIFSMRKVPAAFAVDEFGGVTGIVCRKDIYGRILGDIAEEFERSDWQARKLDESTWAVKGNVMAEDLVEKIPGLRLPESESSTMSGILIEALSDFPKLGDKIAVGNCIATVTMLAGNRILGFELSILPDPAGEES